MLLKLVVDAIVRAYESSQAFELMADHLVVFDGEVEWDCAVYEEGGDVLWHSYVDRYTSVFGVKRFLL